VLSFEERRLNATRFTLHPIPPFRLDLTAWVLRRRPANRIDLWDGKIYSRVLALGPKPLLIEAEQKGPPHAPEVLVRLSGPGLSSDSETLALRSLERSLGLGIDLAPFYEIADRDPALASLVHRFAGMKPTRYPSLFEAIANGIIGQQLSLIAAVSILNRFAARFGTSFGGSEPSHAFPHPEALSGIDQAGVRPVGVTWNKARALLEAAREISSGSLRLERIEALDNQAVVAELLKLRGVGQWTADYVLLRGLGRLDVFPRGDAGAIKSLRMRMKLDEPLPTQRVAELLSPWQRYSGLVYFHLLLAGLAEEGLVR
jgi:DNA-3-methyladenine glycosylase II